MSERSARGSSGPPGHAGVSLLPPRLQPLSGEQRAEAVALLSDLLLAASRLAGDSPELATGDDGPRKEALAA